AVVIGQGQMMGRKGHGLFLGPLVGAWIILEDHAGGLPQRNQAAEGVHFTSGGCTEHLLTRLREGRQVHPFALAVCQRYRSSHTDQKDGEADSFHIVISTHTTSKASQGASALRPSMPASKPRPRIAPDRSGMSKSPPPGTELRLRRRRVRPSTL